MADEKKEEPTKEAKAPEQKAATESPSPAAQSEPAAAKEEKKEAQSAKPEKATNCAGCKKSIKNKRWYYRDGKYYCSKRCWQVANKKPAKTEATASAT